MKLPDAIKIMVSLDAQSLLDNIEKRGLLWKKGPIIVAITQYAEKWQAAEARAERAEKALREIRDMSHDSDKGYKMKLIAYYALTPKTGEDENA